MELRTIEIDFEIHKCIEAERNSFAESANDVLRRLLGIKASENKPVQMIAAAGEAGRSWTGKGVTLPNGTQIRMDYNGQVLTGTIRDGKWLVGGHEFSSPSAAASAMCLTKAGKRTQLDGWKYWEAKRPGDEKWMSIGSLRPDAIERHRQIIDRLGIDLDAIQS